MANLLSSDEVGRKLADAPLPASDSAGRPADEVQGECPTWCLAGHSRQQSVGTVSRAPPEGGFPLLGGGPFLFRPEPVLDIRHAVADVLTYP